MPSLATGLTIAVTALLAVPLLAFSTGTGPGCPQPADPATTSTSAGVGAGPDGSNHVAVAWDGEQRAVAATIIRVGQARGLPPRAQVIALATAIQESGLRNLPGGDRDSIGVFQQRPSAGWGSPAQLASPAYQADRFYTALVAVPGWQTLPLTDAAQAVQRSGFPHAYADDEAPATALLATTVGSTDPRARPEDLEQFVSAPGCVSGGGDGLPAGGQVKLPAGFALPPDTPGPVVAAVAWALAQLGTPYSYGGDCTAAHSGDLARQCDCSSLMQMAYRSAGVDLPRTTFAQVQAGIPVQDLAGLRPGDLVFIPGANGTTHGHVGLVIGQGLLIQAPRSGDSVRLSRVEDWSSKVSAVRRVVP